MGLQLYHKKRDFSHTPEPRGHKKKRTSSGWSFVIQKHAARHLHYDFRLELEGTLKSWAVPKGPSLNPKDKRLAVHVEDHPIEYGDFEGVIPPKQYGGGTVLLWDRGTWEPVGDPIQGYRKGRLKFRLRGEKLHGGWTLARMGAQDEEGKENWLLIKENDEAARTGTAADVTTTLPESVASGRDLETIATDKDRVWHSNKSVVENISKKKDAVSSPIKGRKAILPLMLTPQLATLVQKPPEGDEWLHEIKYDGYRILARIKKNKSKREVQLFSRNEKDWTHKFSTIADSLAKLLIEDAWLDGEIVVVQADGSTSFQALQNTLTTNKPEALALYLFDILFLNGFDLRELSLIERKRILEELLKSKNISENLRYSDHIDAVGTLFYQQACKRSLEGVISKRRDAPYRSTRSKDWVKTKCIKQQEFVIGGFSDPTRARKGFGALLLGVYDDAGQLHFTGKVGTGFNDQMLKELHARLKKIEQGKPPFINPPSGAEARGVHWVNPELVAEVNFTEWTQEGAARHPAFQGLREDKLARSVKREEPSTVEDLANDKVIPRNTKKSPRPKDKNVIAGVEITHPDRILYEKAHITKRDIALYYESVANWIFPHLDNRPLTLVRCPEGSQGECFYQKHANKTVSKLINRVEIIEDAGPEIYMTANSLESIIALVQMGALELHTWGSRNDKVEFPDRIILDLDPDPELAWEIVVEAARFVRAKLQSLKLESFVKTTGGKGLHVVIPIVRKYEWEEVKQFSKALAEDLVRTVPDLFVSKMAKSKRQQKIFIDYLRNGRGATAVAAYSTRAKPDAPISVPINWDELNAELRSDAFNIKNISERLKRQKIDPWDGYDNLRQSLTKTMKRELGID